MAQRPAQDGPHVVVSSQKQQNMDLAVTVLQEEGLSMMGTMCHRGRQRPGELVATVRTQGGECAEHPACSALGGVQTRRGAWRPWKAV